MWKEKAFPKSGVLTKIKNSAAVGTQSQVAEKKIKTLWIPRVNGNYSVRAPASHMCNGYKPVRVTY